MAIAHENQTSASSASASSLTWSHTTSGSNKILIVGVGTRSTTETVSTVTHNGKSLTQLSRERSTTLGSYAELWYIVAPDTTGNIVVTFTGAEAIAAIGNSYTGVHQTNSFAITHGRDGSGTTSSIEIGSATNDVVVDVGMHRDSGAATITGGQTLRGDVSPSASLRVSMSDEAGSAVNTLSWSWINSAAIAHVAVPLRPTASTAPAVQRIQKKILPTNSASTTATLTFDATATSGNMLVTAIAIDKDGGTPTITSGWSTPVVIKASTSSTLAYSYKVSAGTETSVVWTFTSHTNASWFGEYSGISGTAPDKTASANSGASAVTSQVSGTTATTTQADALALGLFSADTGTNVETGRSLSNSFAEALFSNTSSSPSLLVSDKILTSTGTISTTFSNTDTGDQQCGAMLVFKVGATISTALTGTATASIVEADVVTGGKTIILTLTGDTWVAAGTGPIGSTANTQALIDGITSAQSETLGWNAEVRDKEVTTAVVRTSSTVATITLTASASYNITAQETITATIPAATLVTSSSAIVASPTFTVDFTASGVGIPIAAYHYNHNVGSKL